MYDKKNLFFNKAGVIYHPVNTEEDVPDIFCTC